MLSIKQNDNATYYKINLNFNVNDYDGIVDWILVCVYDLYDNFFSLFPDYIHGVRTLFFLW